MLRTLAVFAATLVFTVSGFAQQSRHFTFHYTFTIKNIPAGKKIRVWIPAAHSDSYQEVNVLSATGDLRLKKTHESEYGNETYFAESADTTAKELHFDVEYDVVRRERVALQSGTHLIPTALTSRERAEDLQPYALVPITGLPAELAKKVTEGKTDPLDKARAIYDYVFSTMKYDKSGTGWGRGDVLYACDARKGNCTDFHSLFISMARSQNIPARFEIGFLLPEGKQSGEIAGYHCWSDFYIEGKGWIPVDISEAWLHPAKHDFYFGSHDANRVQFTMGRDLRLNPQQQGKLLNYLVYPYVEVDGQAYPNVSLAFSFADVGPNVASKDSHSSK